MESYIIGSRTKKGVKYSVSNLKKGWRCDCKWWTIKRTDCIHIKLAKAMGEQLKNATDVTDIPDTKALVPFVKHPIMTIN